MSYQSTLKLPPGVEGLELPIIGPKFLWGNGSPEAVVIAPPGSTYFCMRSGRTFRKFTGVTATGWKPVQQERGAYDEFKSPFVAIGPGGAAVSGVANSVNSFATDRNVFDYCVKGTANVTLVPEVNDLGYDISLDAGNGEGIEITPGLSAVGRQVYTTGTDAFRFAVKLRAATGEGGCYIAGFRKVEGYQASKSDYTELFACGMGAKTVDKIGTFTILANAADVTADENPAHAANIDESADYEFEVRCAANRVVTFYMNGVLIPGVPAYTAAAATKVIPFVWILGNANADAVTIRKWDCSLQ